MKDVLATIVPLTLMLCVFLFGYLADPLKIKQTAVNHDRKKRMVKS